MRTRVATATAFVVLLLACAAAPVFGQAPAPPPKIWTVTANAGLPLTSGNSDTSSVNLAYDLTYDPQTRNVVKSDGLYLRGETEGGVSTHRTGLNIRDEYKLTDRIFVFGQNQYLKDEFKNIDYLIAPTGGVGYKIIDTATTKFGVDGSAGMVWEKKSWLRRQPLRRACDGREAHTRVDRQHDAESDVHGTVEDRRLRGRALHAWRERRRVDVHRTQLKFEVLDTFKNKPPLPTIQANDVAVLMSIVYKV